MSRFTSAVRAAVARAHDLEDAVIATRGLVAEIDADAQEIVGASVALQVVQPVVWALESHRRWQVVAKAWETGGIRVLWSVDFAENGWPAVVTGEQETVCHTPDELAAAFISELETGTSGRRLMAVATKD